MACLNFVAVFPHGQQTAEGSGRRDNRIDVVLVLRGPGGWRSAGRHYFVMVDLRRFVLFLLYYDRAYYYVGDKHCLWRSLYTSLLRHCLAVVHCERKTLVREGAMGKKERTAFWEGGGNNIRLSRAGTVVIPRTLARR